ncbi:MAG: helix-turn-helix domain-containing protein [Candidatus Binatia bacterium]
MIPTTLAQNTHTLDLSALPETFLLDDIQAAKILNVSPGTLCVWRSTGRYNLKYVKVGRKVRYKAGDLREFLENRTRTHTRQ